MLEKVLIVSAVALILASHSGNAVNIQCGDMSPPDCRKEFGKQMDKMAMEEMIEMLNTLMTKTVDMYTTVKNNIPADSMHSKVIAETFDKINNARPKIDKWEGMSSEDLEDALQKAFISVQPNFTNAQKEDIANKEKFEQEMEKQGFFIGMIEEHVMMMMMEFEKKWTDAYSSIRDEDKKMYPQYLDMNELMATMITTTDRTEKMKIFTKMMKKMLDFNDTPLIKAMMNTMCSNCPLE